MKYYPKNYIKIALIKHIGTVARARLDTRRLGLAAIAREDARGWIPSPCALKASSSRRRAARCLRTPSRLLPWPSL